MGNWNRRWIPRKKYKYQDFPPSPPHHYNQFYSHAIQENSVPSWEIDFCRAAGIPWHKVLNAKTYMHCYDNVVKWDDSAGEEALNNAKKRYWAEISGLPPQSPPPNPDVYIDKVDWDPTIDPELILDLDREYFNPEAANTVKSENNLVSGILIWEDKAADNGENPWESGNVQDSKTGDNDENPWESGNLQGSKTGDSGENPWESGNAKGSKAFEDVEQTWNEWDNPVNIKDNDPWERNCPKTQGTLKDTAWGGCTNESWGWSTGWKYENDACADNNLCYQGSENVSGFKGNEWVNNRTGSWGRNRWNTRGHEQWNSDYGSQWNRNLRRGGGTTSKDRRWGESEYTSWDWQRQPRQSNERNVDFGRPRRGDKTFYTGSRKREGSSQHMLSYKSSRFQGDEQRTAYNWRDEKPQKRVTFSIYD
ncbi:bifunctional endo-1,4-beta-xylanase XylA [Capsicum galapagoense]